MVGLALGLLISPDTLASADEVEGMAALSSIFSMESTPWFSRIRLS